MDELILLSSDTESYSDDKENLNDELDALLQKYQNIDSTEKSQPKKIKINNDVSPSSTDTECENDYLSVQTQIESVSKKLSPKFLKQAEKEEKLKRKNEEKAQKEAERTRKKIEAEKLKAEKRALSEAYKQMKPEEAIKQVRCVVDNRISDEIIRGLEAADITCKRIEGQHKQPSVTWVRQAQPRLTDLDGQLGFKLDEETMPTLYVIQHNDLLNLSKTDQLLPLAVKTKSLVTIIEIDGAKWQRQEEKIIENALTELQIVSGWSHRKIKSNTELIEVIRQYTKSVALAPSKRLKASTKGEITQPPSSDCVRVQSNTGYGLSALWLRQLGQFPLASLETAHAVAKLYPTPKSLANAKERAEVVDELADAQVRRANGPLSAPRRLGPQLAKKVHMAMTSRDPNAIL